MALSNFDLWRLSDELSVIDAAILIAGEDPSERAYVTSDTSRLIEDLKNECAGFTATFSALTNAIRSNSLPASIRHIAERVGGRDSGTAGSPANVQGSCENVSCRFLVTQGARDAGGRAIANFDLGSLNDQGEETISLWKEPDWQSTTIRSDALKDWLKSRGVEPEFFFPQGQVSSFMDKRHPRYAPKLAACVAAWEAVTEPKKNCSVKQTIADWLQSNAAAYGVGDENGIVSPSASDDLARIVNWAPGGGATPTQTHDEVAHPLLTREANNYPFESSLGDKGVSDASKTPSFDDEEIPF